MYRDDLHPDAGAEHDDRYRRLIERAPDAMVVIRAGVVVYANPAAVTLSGAGGVAEVEGTSALGWFVPEDRQMVAEHLAAARRAGKDMAALDARLERADGSIAVAEITASSIEWGGRPAAQAVLRDVTSQRADMDELQVARTALAALAEGVLVLDAAGAVVSANHAAAGLLERPRGDLIGWRLAGDDAELMDEGGGGHGETTWPVASALEGGIATTGQVLGRRPRGGAWRWLSVSTRLLPGPGCVLTLVDVTAEREASAARYRTARYDPLTGLPNRRLLLERLTSTLARTRRTDTPTVAVLFVGIDAFASLNDALGGAVADEVLVEVADRLNGAVRPGDVVARFGGDEFVLVAEEVAGIPGAEALAGRLTEAVERPIPLGGESVAVTVSTGIAMGRVDADATTLLREADAAMVRVKFDGGARYELYDGRERVRALRRLELEADLRRAIARGALSVEYQPEIELRTGRVAVVEALVRWNHPEYGGVPAAELVAVAEDTGLIGPLGRMVLAEALQQVVAWRAAGLELVVAVNVSARQLSAPDVLGWVASALDDAGADAEWLCLEITETALAEANAGVLDALLGLRSIGVQLAMDDFGTGSSSLAALRTLPVDVVKLDRRFQDGLEKEGPAREVVAAVHKLVHALGLKVVAEGVEDEASLEALDLLGCDLAQGFGLAPPMAAEAVAAFVRSR